VTAFALTVLLHGRGAGRAKISIPVAALVDTNVLVYRFDGRFPQKQSVATSLLRHGIETDTVRVAHQSVVEFVAAVTRPIGRAGPLLALPEALREAEELLSQFTVLYPNDAIVRLAMRGAAAYQLPWFDAHLWAFAEHYGLAELLSEDFQHDRRYGTVRVINPFIDRSR
jgi:predicted nucleic acid-binding protein